MEREDAIEYIENLREGDFLTVNIPIFQDEIAPVTAMYVGKTKDGAYRFVDAGNFTLSKDFLQKGKVTIDKGYDDNVAKDIKDKIQLEEKNKLKQKKNKDYR